MVLPFEILVMYTAIALLVGVIGIILGIKKISGSPFITIFAGIMLFGLFAIVGNLGGISNVGGNYLDIPKYANSHPMNVTTSDSSVAFSATITGLAERPANVNSQLTNKKINCIEVNLLRTGSPTDNVMIGILDNDNRMVKLFGNISASSINTGTRSYQVCLPSHDYWVIAYNDYVGIKHTGSVGANNIAVSMNTGNPFDSTNSVRATYTSGVWSDTTTTDLRMKLTSEDLTLEKQSIPYALTDNTEWIYLIVLSTFFVLLGIIMQVQKW